MADRVPAIFHYGPADEDIQAAAQPEESAGRDEAAAAGAVAAKQTVSEQEQRVQPAQGTRRLQERGSVTARPLPVRNADIGGPQVKASANDEGQSGRGSGSSMAGVQQADQAVSGNLRSQPKSKKAAKPPRGGPKKVGKDLGPPPKAAVEPIVEEVDTNDRLRREKAEILARTLREHNAAVFEAQMALLEGPTTDKQLQASRRLLPKSDYDDIIEERAIAGVCGYPLCDNVLPQKDSRKGHYRISLAHKRVFDTSDTVRFCGLDHVVRSGAFRASLEDERPLLPTGDELQAIVATVTGRPGGAEKRASFQAADVTKRRPEEEGSSASPAVMSATLVERTPGDVSADVSAPEAGQSDAIEGYVPRRGAQKRSVDGSVGARSRKSGPVKGAASREAERKVEQESGLQKNGETDATKVVSGRREADLTMAGMGTGFGESGAEWSRRLDQSAAEAGISVSRYTEGEKESPVPTEAGSTDEASRQRIDAASSGMTSEPRPSKRSAEEKGKAHGAAGKGVVESLKKGANGATDFASDRGQPEEEPDLRLQSAQAVATALAEAAARVETGEFDATEAMQSLGMTVQPANEGAPSGSRRDARSKRASASLTEISGLENEEGPEESGGVKRGLETGGVVERNESENRQTEQGRGSNATSTSGASVTPEEDEDDDSGQGWMGAPPQGFSAELSQFGRLWTALDSWISADTLRFLHGPDAFFQGGESEGGVISVGGRDYEPRVVLDNGASAAIRRAFQECVRRALPDVQRAMQLKVPRPELEEALGNLVRTFSFTDPLPPLKSPGWQLLTLLMLHALSRRSTPVLGSSFEDRPSLGQALETLKGDKKEYELLHAKLVPAGSTNG
ncbi:hypothetical protein KFL_001500020 [Klebsormidium nitens]|uniref:RNA polymerase II subunit B1 CTD phosphatase RPAP2 homolog n=1 Tax=Klebsormidium nitens TaxID=105231 RepID=A0A1Y1I0H7_KLENI|nr:hypothetical protein KFL_001500020 [Klebsormidium nitens]|eukprot:GAQ83472.1 hypothetical protein KFL_001500020 [Klebsormidium nitens]